MEMYKKYFAENDKLELPESKRLVKYDENISIFSQSDFSFFFIFLFSIYLLSLYTFL